MNTRGITVVALVLAAAGSAVADPGGLVDMMRGEDSPVTVLDAAKAQPCALKTGLCVAAGARSTVSVASAPVVAETKRGGAAPIVPRFSRAASVASSGSGGVPGNAPWTLEVGGTLKRPAWAGNAIFVIFDLDDPEALENRQFTGFYQAAVKAGPKLAARLVLTPDEGYRAGHAYRLRIVQLIGGKEMVLAESDFSLL